MHPADHNHGEEFARERHGHRFRRYQIRLKSEQRTGDPGYHCRQDENRKLVTVDWITLERGA